ncbi:hypothetical protein DJ030_06395 [bacterium endosymbiont of Escarpia laminata]|nr:MAG: hypothetical protein DJ030_06395 [bacterium endosymbiont of Escarpia laminata]
MKTSQKIAIFVTLFLISFSIVYHKAQVTVDTAAQIAFMTSLIKSAAVVLLDKWFNREIAK